MSGQQGLKFVSEEEVVEQRQRRQAEWERTRKEDDPEECPEEESRSLFEQLQANKSSKDKDFDDENRLRSSVKGLDNEEVQFLNYVSTRQMQLERERSIEERSLIKEMEAAKVIKLEDKNKKTEPQVTTDKSKASSSSVSSSSSSSASGGKRSQLQLLSGAIKRKSVDTESSEQAKKAKSSEGGENPAQGERPDAKLMEGIPRGSGSAVVAGVLPGIANYYRDDDDSSDSNSSDSEVASEPDLIVYPSAVTQRVIQDMVKKLKSDCG